MTTTASVDVRDARRPLTRAAVVDGAARLVDEHGADALTMTRLAAELDVTLPALYNHVRSADDCRRVLSLRVREDLLGRLRAAIGTSTGPDAVVAAARAWRGYALAHPGRYAVTARSPLADDEHCVALLALVDVLASTFEGCGLGPDDARTSAWALRAALHGAAAVEVEGACPDDAPTDAAFERLLSLVLYGVGPATAGAARPAG